MNVPAPRTSALFDQQVRDLARAGVAPSPAESWWLGRLCERATKQAASVDAYVPPVLTAQGIQFRPLTIQAMIWLEDFADGFFDGGGDYDQMYRLLAEGYALANPAGNYGAMRDKLSAMKELRSWYYGCKLTLAQLRTIVASFSAINPCIDIPWATYTPPVQATDWGRAIAKVCEHYPAVKPDDVLSKYTIDQVSDMLRACGDSTTAADLSLEFEQLRAAVAKVKADHGCC